MSKQDQYLQTSSSIAILYIVRNNFWLLLRFYVINFFIVNKQHSIRIFKITINENLK